MFLDIQNITFAYDNTHKVLDKLNLSIEEGTMLGILGPNGCGKSTLFDILTLHHRCKQGDILFRGQSVDHNVYLKHVGCVFQHSSLDPYLTISENLKMQGRLYGMTSHQLEDKIQEISEALMFKDRINQMAKDLSGGFARRVDIAKALLHEPELILLDEPTTGLDPASRRDMLNWMKDVQKSRGATIVWITHLTQEIETMDRVVMLDSGHIVCDGHPQALIREMDIVQIDARISSDASELGGLASQCVAFDLSQGVLKAHVSKSHMKDVLEQLVQHTSEMQYRMPNLEDVYLQRTGHALT